MGYLVNRQESGSAGVLVFAALAREDATADTEPQVRQSRGHAMVLVLQPNDVDRFYGDAFRHGKIV